jgi:hypothetical protein
MVVKPSNNAVMMASRSSFVVRALLALCAAVGLSFFFCNQKMLHTLSSCNKHFTVNSNLRTDQLLGVSSANSSSDHLVSRQEIDAMIEANVDARLKIVEDQRAAFQQAKERNEANQQKEASDLDLFPSTDHCWMNYMDRYKYQAPIVPRNSPVPAEICGNRSDANSSFFQQDKQLRSANMEDLTIYTTFRDEIEKLGRKATYVELGAFDGVRESNTKFFDDCLGWNGLLIEGNPAQYSQLITNRPFAHRMSFAPSCDIKEEMENATVDFHATAFTNAGMEGYALGYGKGHLNVQVPCGSLTPVLLDVFPNGHVDFFLLDVEGSEPLVVNNINFSKVFIEVLMVENMNSFCRAECESRTLVHERMKSVGYKRYSDVVTKSDLYIHPMSKFQIKDRQADA